MDPLGLEDAYLFDFSLGVTPAWSAGTVQALAAAGPAALEMGGSMVPYVGEAMDVALIMDPASRWWERGLAGISLGANSLTAGLLPNFGGLVRGGKRICRLGDDVVDIVKTEASMARGWKVGEPINNLTSKGNVPAWDTVRNRFWKNEALNNPEAYSTQNLSRMQGGRAPQRINPITGTLESMELHHTPAQRDGGLFNVQKVWPDEHAAVDPFRHTGD